MKFYINLLFSILIFFSTFSNAQIKIATSTQPIADLVNMLLGKQARIEVIAASNGCPHHYHAKPSDLTKIKEADLILYINKNFDGFITNLAKDYQGKFYRISDIKNLKLLTFKDEINWHVWLDLNNAKLILDELANYLSVNFSEYKEILAQNLMLSKQKILALQQIKEDKLNHLIKPIVLSDNLEYLFVDTKVDLVHLHHQQNNLKFYTKLQDILGRQPERCLIIDNEQNLQSFKKFKANIIQIDPENWRAKPQHDFVTSYNKIIEQLSACNGVD